MAEPRARARTKGQVFNTNDLNDLLYAYGDNTRTPQSPSSLPTTITSLDEILTDFIIETCHAAALSASYSRRQKIKVDDFKWVLRKDERLLGRVLDQLWRVKKIGDDRKAIQFDKMQTEGLAVGALEDLAKEGGAEKEVKKVGRGRRKKRKAEDEGGGERKRIAS